MRPIYLHKDERIEAMLMVNMIALLVYSLAERRCRRNGLQITTRHLIYEFRSLHVIETRCRDDSILYRCMPLTAHQRKILEQIGLAGKTLLDAAGWQTDEVLGTRLTFPPPREYSLLEGGRAA